MASSVRILTAQNVYVEYPLASVYERGIAWFIDGMLKSAYLWALIMVFEPYSTTIIILMLLPFLFYDFILEVLTNGYTVGKRIMKIRVISAKGGETGLSQYMLRWLLSIVEFVIFTPGMAILVMWLSRYSQRLGDLAAQTCVIALPDRKFNRIAPITLIEEKHEVKYPQAFQLSDQDYWIIQQLIRKYRFEPRSKALHQAIRKIKEHLQITPEQGQHPINFLRVLVKDYEYLHSSEETIRQAQRAKMAG